MRSNKAVFILFLFVGFSVFFNGLNGDFVHDDILVLSHSFFNQSDKVFDFFRQSYFEDFYQAGLYRPLTQISFVLNFLIGSSPFGFHSVNVLLHVINSFLVFILARRMRLTGMIGLIGPVAASLLFLVLPVHVEAVTSIVGRAELLSFLFGMSAILLWFNSRHILSALALFLALLSKETAVAVPAIILFLNWHYRRDWKWLICQAGTLIAYFILRIAVLGEYAFKTKAEFIFNPLAYVSFPERVFTALKVLTLYFQKIFLPFGLSADYSYNQVHVVTNLFSSPLALAGLIILGLMLWAIRRRSIWPIFFFFPYLLVSNLIFPTGTIMGERLMYFPSLGLVLILGLVFDHLSRFSKKIGWTTLLTLVFIYGLLTIGQNRVWLSREALLTDIFESSPDSLVAKTEYGILVLNKDKDLAKRLSLEVYEKYPDYIQNLNLRAAVEVQEGNFTKAQEFLERALELRPKHQNTLQNLSRVYFTLGKYREAEEALKVSVFKYGGKGNVIFYALVQAKNGRFDESSQTLYSFFGLEIKDESALKILRGEFKELEDSFIFHKPQ